MPVQIVRRIEQIAGNVNATVRGYRDARRLAPGVVADATSARETEGTLEEYFDANTNGAGIWKWRHYFPIYERHLARFVGTDAVVAEIGVYSGGSLGMWRHYFGDRVQIVGIDIEPACRVYARDSVRVVIGDQQDPAFWSRFRQDFPRVDVLIDDGGHTPRQQIVTLAEMLAHLRPGGVYICEDIHGQSNPFHAYVDALSRPLHNIWGEIGGTPPEPIHQHVESVHRYPLMTVIEKPHLPVADFASVRHGTEWQPFLDATAPPPPT